MSDTDAPAEVTGGHVRRDSRGRRIGRNWWREYNCEILSEAEAAWQALKESGEAIMTTSIAGADYQTGYYQLSEAEYRQLRPRPTLKHLLVQNAGIGRERDTRIINGHTAETQREESPWPTS